MKKFLQSHHQPRTPRKRSVPPVKDHSAIVNIFQKFCKNGPCIQIISFRVTMVSSICKCVICSNWKKKSNKNKTKQKDTSSDFSKINSVVDCFMIWIDWYILERNFQISMVTSLVIDTLRFSINLLKKTEYSSPGHHSLADITPVFKRKNPSHKVTYRPVSVLPNI